MKKILNRAAALVSAVILMLTVQIPAAAQAKDINTALSQGKSLLRGASDNIIDIIAEAQCADGYLYELFTAPSEKKIGWGAGDKPYSFVLHSHELYNMGHMYEGAVAYYRATGKRKWLDVAEKMHST